MTNTKRNEWKQVCFLLALRKFHLGSCFPTDPSLSYCYFFNQDIFTQDNLILRVILVTAVLITFI